MFVLESGRALVEWYPKKASTEFNNGDLVYADGSGHIQPADATSGDHIGIIMKDVKSTDDDYAENTYVPVLIPTDESVFRVDVGTGTLTTAMIGNQYDLKDASSIDVTATAKKVVTVVGFVSGSVALVKINAVITNVDVQTT